MEEISLDKETDDNEVALPKPISIPIHHPQHLMPAPDPTEEALASAEHRVNDTLGVQLDKEDDEENLDGAGFVISPDPMSNPQKLDEAWDSMKAQCLPKPGKERSFFIGIAIELTFFVIWLILIFTVLDAEQRNKLWYMPLLGIAGATIAMATPAGGGIFYFPALTLLNTPANEAIAFNFCTAMISMGVFGAISWFRKSRSSVVVWMNLWVVTWGWFGCVLSLFIFPIHSEVVLRILFTVFSLFLMIYVIYGLFAGSLDKTDQKVDRRLNSLLGLGLAGLAGGILLGWISVGIDITIFMALTAGFKCDSRKATVTSVFVLGWTCIFPAFYHIVELQDVPYDIWLMVLGGCLIGARIGPLLNKLAGKKVMMVLFVLILAIEVVRTFVELVILPSVNKKIVGDV